MKWITAEQLEVWGETNASSNAFPGMVGDLIVASIPADRISSYRFPRDGKGNVRGFDGDLTVEGVGSHPFVPEGRSVWEFGTGKSNKKPWLDFENRTRKVEEGIQEECMLVLCTTLTYDNPMKLLATWQTEVARESAWRSVRLIDGSMLEDWLSQNPGVAAAYARAVLGHMPQTGAVSLEEFWEEYVTSFDPRIDHATPLVGRETEAKSFLRSLSSGRSFGLVAYSPDEAMAFAAGAVLGSQDEDVRRLKAQSIVVHTEKAARFLGSKSNTISFVMGAATSSFGRLSQHGTAVHPKSGVHRRPDDLVLPEPSVWEFEDDLARLGLERPTAEFEARRCGRNLTIMRRARAVNGQVQPYWLGEARTLLPALLAGAWSNEIDDDRDVLARLSRFGSYDDYEHELQAHVDSAEPVFEVAGEVWSARSQIDGLIQAAPHLKRDTLALLRDVVVDVFSPPKAKPQDPDALYSRPVAPHSEYLRRGLAGALLTIGCLPEMGAMPLNSRAARDMVREVVQRLPALNGDLAVMESLDRELPYIAEAAPVPFLDALERALGGDGETIASFLTERDGLVLPDAKHTGLLFALETLAWLPEHLDRAVALLFRLARHDPGGQIANRPLASLRDVFLVWSPSTYADQATRLSVLEKYVRSEDATGWKLLVSLLPRHHDTGSPNSKPRFRTGAAPHETLTNRMVFEARRAIVGLALNLADGDGAKLTELVERASGFDEDGLATFTRAVDEALADDSDEASTLWKSLRAMTLKHRAFHDADWTLKGAPLEGLEAVVAVHSPGRPMERVVWLFDDWLPILPKNENAEQISRRDAVDEARLAAVGELYERGGAGEFLELAKRSKLPQIVGGAVAELARERGMDVATDTLRILGDAPPEDPFTAALASQCAHEFRDAWKTFFRDWSSEASLPARRVAIFLTGWPDDRDTWMEAAQYGSEVESSYWRLKQPHRVKEVEAAREAATRYSAVGRPLAAVSSVSAHFNTLESEFVLRLLREVAAADASVIELLYIHHLDEALEALRVRDDVDLPELAAVEFAFFPRVDTGRGRKDPPLGIHRLMAQDPKTFLNMLRIVFRPEGEEEPQASDKDEAASARFRAAFQVLRSFTMIPGSDGDTVDGEALVDWTEAVRRMAGQRYRSVAESYIGQMLAHAPADAEDGAWPTRAVRDVIERVANNEIVRGIYVGIRNKRGVYSKSVYEGGGQERDIADRYAEDAENVAQWPRVAALLRKVADAYRSDAQGEDTRANQDRIRFAQ